MAPAAVGRGGGALSIDDWEPLPAGTYAEPMLLSFSSDPSHHVSHVGGGLRVSDAVDRVEVTHAGETLEATVDEGIAMFWLPGGGSEGDVAGLVFTAYDASGAVLSTGPA